MAKKSFDDDNDYENIRPGSIDVDDLFGSSDKPFEENEVDVETVNESESTEDYSDYIFGDNDEPVNVSDEESDMFSESSDEDISPIDDYDEDENASDSVVLGQLSDVVEEESTEEVQKPSYVETASKQVEETLDEIHRQNEEEPVEKIAEKIVDEILKTPETEESENDSEDVSETSEKETLTEMVDEALESIKEESDEPKEIKDVGFEEDEESEIDNPTPDPVSITNEDGTKGVIETIIPDGEIPDDPKPAVEIIHPEENKTIEETQEKLNQEFETEKLEKTIENIEKAPEDEKPEERKLTPEEKEYFATEADGSLADFMKKAFRRNVELIQSKFTENSLINYLEGYSSKEDRELIKEQYCYNYSKYYQYVNFNNPNAKAALWILTAGEFAEMIEQKKFNGEIQPVLVKGNGYDNDPNNIEDENITALKEKRRKESIEQSKYGIDRTVWDIDDDIAEENTSIFDEQKDLFSEFKKSEFYGILSQVMESTRIADMSKVECKVVIKEICGYYPVIDFNTGIRLICIDTEDASQYNNHPLLFNRKLPFSYKVPKTGIKTRILYSDICRECPVAVVFALKKLVAFDYIKPRYKIDIAKNYVISYTTEQTYLDMFEKGDPDSKRPGSSTYYAPKPATNFLGIVVLDKKTEKDIKSVHRNQVYKDLNKMPEVSVDNYDPQFILSARYIRNDLRLRNPTIPMNQRFVEYTITQYTECNSVIVNDGFQVVCACIIKEHRANYAPGTPYSISFEFDRDNLLTPAVVRMLDTHDGFEPSLIRKCQPLELMQTFILPPSRKKLDGVLPSEKGRLDVRYFTPQSIQSRYRDQRDLWSRYDLTNQQGRNEFIKSRGFELFMSPKYMTFDIMPDCLMAIENGNVIRNIQKISITALTDRNSDDTINLLNRQKEMEYYQSLDNSEMGTFQKFLINAANIMMDYLSGQNN